MDHQHTDTNVSYQTTYANLKATAGSSVARIFCAAYEAYLEGSPMTQTLLQEAKESIELALEGWRIKILIPDEQLEDELNNALFIVTNLLSKPTTPLQ